MGTVDDIDEIDDEMMMRSRHTHGHDCTIYLSINGGVDE